MAARRVSSTVAQNTRHRYFMARRQPRREEKDFSRPLKAGFSDLGYVEGKTIFFEERYPAEQKERFEELRGGISRSEGRRSRDYDDPWGTGSPTSDIDYSHCIHHQSRPRRSQARV